MSRSSSRFSLSSCVFGCALTLLILTCDPAEPSPFETYGLGGRPIAMGGAVSSIVEDYTATHYNPAGLAFADRPMISFGFVYGTPNLRLTGENPNFVYAGKKPLNGQNQDIDDIRAFQVGGTFPLTRGRLRFIKIGVAANVPTTSLVRPVSMDAMEPHFVYFINHPQRMELKICVAFKIFSVLSVGGGVDILANLKFPLKLQWFNVNETWLVGSVPTDPVFAPLGGIRFNPTNSLSLSAVYRGEILADLVLDVNLTSFGEPFVPPVEITLINYFKPQEVVLGASYRFVKKLLVGVDVAWMDYSKAKTPMPYYEFDVPQAVRVFLSMINAPPPDFHDIVVPRIGVEYAINEHVAVRSGYAYKPSPVPNQYGSNNYADANRHMASVGAGVRFVLPWNLMKKPINVDAVFQAQILEHRTMIKVNPDDPTGNFAIDGEMFLGGIFLKYDL